MCSRLVQQVGQHVETPTVGHANYDLVNALRRTALYQRIQKGDERFSAFQREALLTEFACARTAQTLLPRPGAKAGGASHLQKIRAD